MVVQENGMARGKGEGRERVPTRGEKTHDTEQKTIRADWKKEDIQRGVGKRERNDINLAKKKDWYEGEGEQGRGRERLGEGSMGTEFGEI